MITLTTNDGKKAYKLNTNDIKLLVIISLGASSCTDIAEVLGVSKPAITQKIIKFENAGLAKSTDVYGIKHYKSEYILTKKGHGFVEEILKDRFVA